MSRRSKTNLTIAAACALAGTLRLCLIPYVGCIHPDGVSYIEIATRFLTGRGPFDPIFPPLYPLLIGLFHGISDDLEGVGRLISALFGACVVWPAALLGRWIYGERVARYTAIIVALHPVLTEYSTYVLTEAHFTALLTLALIAAYKALTGGSLFAFCTAGAVLGLAAMMRPEALAYVPFVLLISLFRWWKRIDTRQRIIPQVILLLLSFILICFPYARYLKATTGSWTLSGKTGVNLTRSLTVGAQDIGPAADQIYRSMDHPRSLLHELINQPGTFVKRAVMNLHLTHKYILTGLFPPLLLIVTAVGLLRTTPSDERELFLLVSPLPYLPILLFFVEPRIFLPLVPLAMIWAARGVEQLQQKLSDSLKDEKAIQILLSKGHPVVLVLVFGLLPYTLRPIYRTQPNAIYRDAGRWMKEHAQEQLKIAFPQTLDRVLCQC